jgi:peptidoglycan/xylan/chitin deacetylase (PgdA/CDA1 family)
MRAPLALLIALGLVMPPSAPATAAACPSDAMTKNRVIEIDTSAGPLFGDITKQQKEPGFLAEKEVVLTFDDGPMPWVTRSILDTLDRHCAKATFFSVGRMAAAYPDTVREITNRGHTLGGHTWSHPLNLKRLKLEQALDEIERGFAAVALANRDGVAPFFRFPGLSDSAPMLAALQKRGIATFTVDIVSDDSYIADARRLAEVTLSRIEARKGGIVLFHDIKPATAKALPVILAELSRRGYTFVHLRAKRRLEVMPEIATALAPLIAKNASAAAGKARLVPFYGTIGPERVAFVEAGEAPATTELSPPARARLAVEATAGKPRKTRDKATVPKRSAAERPPDWSVEIAPAR